VDDDEQDEHHGADGVQRPRRLAAGEHSRSHGIAAVTPGDCAMPVNVMSGTKTKIRTRYDVFCSVP
jgi:hypothetical protein